MTPQVLEGTWEEIVAHADELKGCQVRLVVMKPQADQEDESKQRSLPKEWDGLVGTLSFGPDDLAEHSEEYFGQIVEEKYRQGKL